jgi:hypothetical protein
MKANPGGNEQLTALAGVLLIVFLAVEGATLLDLRALLTVHAFVGMFLLPILALKLASTGWRMVSYYLGRDAYVRRGPPGFPLRAVVAPVVVASTIVLFGSGVYLLAVHETHGTAVGLHKASFLVWFVAMSIHVLWYLQRVAREGFADVGRHRLAGAGLRVAVVTGAVAAGTVVAVLTLPLATSWAHWASLHMH